MAEINKNCRATEKKISRLAFALMELHEDDLILVFKQIASILTDHKRSHMLEGINDALMSTDEKISFLKADSWMDKRFSDDITRSPKMMAYACMKALKLPKSAMPKLVILARKIKKRVRLRKRRQQSAELEAALNSKKKGVK